MRDETAFVQERDALHVEDHVDSAAVETPTSLEGDSEPSDKAAKLGLVSTLAVATAACGGGGGGGTGTSGGGAPTAGGGGPSAPPVLTPQTDNEAARFLLQASLSASTAEISELRSEGFEPWLDRQMNRQNDQTARQFFASRGFDQVNNEHYFFNGGLADNMAWSQLLNGGSGVRKRAALALSEFMVVSTNSVNTTWRNLAMGEYWDLLNEHAFGNFRDLLEAITLNPAMGVFLNTRGNRKADPSKGRVPDENFGREIMQLFSIGLFELNIDGTVRTSNGQPIETYDNEDVTGISKVFTGYDFDFTGISVSSPPNRQQWEIADPDHYRQPMTADPSRWRYPRSSGYHSDEEKSFLGTTIPANTGPEDSLRIALDALFNHPNVGPFFGQQMIQRLVTSNPSPAYVQRVASVFNDNGSGTRGDLRAVFKAVLLDDEALSEANITNPEFGKLREPMLRYTQWARTFGARSASGNFDLGNLSDNSSELGQSPLRSPSVFNFFRPGYVPAGSEAADRNMLAPEFQIVNETSVAGYVNTMERIIEGRGWLARDITANYSNELSIAHDSTALLDRLDLLMTAGQLNDNTRSTILSALDAEPVAQSDPDDDKLDRIHLAVLLVMASNDYLVQK